MRLIPFGPRIPLVVVLGIAGPAPAIGQAVDAASAAAALAELDEACERAEPLWPAELCGPVVLVHPTTRTAVTNQPDPAGAFNPRHGAFVGRWPDHLPVANTAIEWEGQMWAMVMLPLPDDTFTRLQLLAHEAFHRIQPELGHEVADPLATHLDEEDGRVWLRLELRALARSLTAEDDAARASALDALLFRSVRHDRFPDAAAIERQLEAHEGLAEYTGVRFALDATGEDWAQAARLVERFETRPTYVRSLGYGSGPALGLLLDRYQPGWRTDFGPAPDLAALLAMALLAPEAPGGPERLEQAVHQAVAYGYDEIRGEEVERAGRMAAQRERYRRVLVEGPVLILELPDRQLMFNPNTVLPLADEGNVYPNSILMGPWGRLTLRDGGALASQSRDRARVAAPEVVEPDPNGIVQGPGWTLELEPGWRLAPGTRPGDVRLEPATAP